MRTLLLIPLLWLLAACSPLQLVDSLTPDSTYRFAASRNYGPLPRQQLDIYLPLPGASTQPAPVVVFFYGGRWQSGERRDYRFVAEALASRGFVVVLPDYRLYPAVRYPEFLADSAAAVAWVGEHIAGYGGDPDNIHLMGHSAGAYNAAMLALDPRLLQRAGMRRPLRSVVGMAGPYDFLPLTDPALQEIFGPPANWPATQPVNYVTAGSPPMLLQTGDADETVKPRNSEALARQLQAKGVEVALLRYAGLDHAGLIGVLAYPLRFRSAGVLDDIETFLRRHRAADAEHAPVASRLAAQ